MNTKGFILLAFVLLAQSTQAEESEIPVLEKKQGTLDAQIQEMTGEASRGETEIVELWIKTGLCDIRGREGKVRLTQPAGYEFNGNYGFTPLTPDELAQDEVTHHFKSYVIPDSDPEASPTLNDEATFVWRRDLAEKITMGLENSQQSVMTITITLSDQEEVPEAEGTLDLYLCIVDSPAPAMNSNSPVPMR